MGGSPLSGYRRLIGHSLAYVATLFVQGLGIAAVAPVATRILSASEFGAATTALVAAQAASILIAFGLPAAVGRLYFERDRGPAQAIALVRSAAIVATGVATAGLCVVAVGWRSDVTRIVGLAIVSAAALAGVLAVQSLLRAERRPASFALVTIGGSLGAQLCGVLVSWSGPATAAAFVAGVAATQAVVSGASIALVLRRRDPSVRAPLRDALRLGLPTVPHLFAAYAVNSADRLLIAALVSTAAVGEYQAAYLVGGAGIALMLAVNSAWSPAVFGRIADGSWKRFIETTAPVGLVISAVLAAGLAFVAPAALVIVAPASYRTAAASDVIALVALATIPFTAYLAAVSVLFVVRRTWSIASATVLAAVVNIALNVALIPALGITGAAVATLVAYLVQAAVVRLWVARSVRVSLVNSWVVLASAAAVAVGVTLSLW